MVPLKKAIRPGRPPSPPDKVRANRLVTFVTNSELSELARLAASRELSMSAICHQLIGESLLKAIQEEDQITR